MKKSTKRITEVSDKPHNGVLEPATGDGIVTTFPYKKASAEEIDTRQFCKEIKDETWKILNQQ
jgi:hypothetical protein